MKRTFFFILLVAMFLSLGVAAFAAEDSLPAADTPSELDSAYLPDTFFAEYRKGTIRLTNPPEGLTLMAAAYNEAGQLTDLQFEKTPGVTVPLNISGETLRVFFLVDNAPICEALDIVIDPADTEFELDRSGAIPEATGSRLLSDAQLRALSGQTPEQAATSISTLADAYAWLNQEAYSTTGMSGINGVDKGIVNGTSNKDASWIEMSTTLNVLLQGDYDEVGTYLCACIAGDPNWPYFYISFNYVKTGGYYYVTDPLCHLPNSGLACCRAYTIKTASLSAVQYALEAANSEFMPITLAAFPLNTADIEVGYNAYPTYITFPSLTGIEYLFHANAADFEEYERQKEAERQEEMARWAEYARTINIADYQMPAAIGTASLSYDTAVALVGQDPELIADRVKSVADVLQYMIAARFGYYSDYFGTPWYDFWGFDAPGDYQISENYGCCCGGYANAVSFLLQGDYDKVGTLRWVSGGNHTISWVYTGGQYYVFDFTQYCSNGMYNNYNCPVTVLDRLEDFYEQMPDTYSYFPKSEVVLMVAFEAGEAMYPSNWQDPPYFTGLTFPAEAEGKITVIYQQDPRYGVKFAPAETEIPGWNA